MPSSRSIEIASFRDFLGGNMRPSVAVNTLAHTERLFPTRKVARGGPVHVLSAGREAFPDVRFQDQGRAFDLNDYLSTNRVAGLLVMKNGLMVLENYELGIGPQTRWASCSIAKSVASVLVGAAIQDGAIGSLDDLLSRYIPSLARGAYEWVTVRHMLTMTSGVRWNETYTDPQSDRRKLLECQLTRQSGAVLRHMNGLGRAGAPGSVWTYNTGDSYVLGAVMEAATGRSLADYLSEKVWAPAGMEQDASWGVECQDGMVLAGSGLSATLRDYARFGQMVADGGRLNGAQLVPEGWFEQGGRPQVVDGREVAYGYMWWIPPQSEPMHVGAFQAEGIYGQCIYVHPRERVVIVVLSARPKPSVVSRLELTDETFFAAVVRALR